MKKLSAVFLSASLFLLSNSVIAQEEIDKEDNIGYIIKLRPAGLWIQTPKSESSEKSIANYALGMAYETTINKKISFQIDFDFILAPSTGASIRSGAGVRLCLSS